MVSELVVTLWCNDLAAMRAFYIDQLGMEEGWFMETPDFGMLVVKGAAFSLMIWRSPTPLPQLTELAGHASAGGPMVPGLGLKFSDSSSYRQVLARLREAGTDTSHEAPVWSDDSFWKLYTLDPMGNTVELFQVPAERPQSTDWLEAG